VLGTGFSSDTAAIANGSFGQSGTGWIFGPDSGLASQSGNPTVPAGNSAYVQARGNFEQSVDNFSLGDSYVISFRAAQQPGSHETFEVLVDGTKVGTFTP